MAVNERKRILVFEDDQPSFDLIRVILGGQDFEMIRAVNGKVGLDIFKQDSDFALILMDIKMPIMDGLEATREIRKINKEIPIIAQTAFAMSGDRKNAIDAGCDGYISKPLRRADLLDIISRYLKK